MACHSGKVEHPTRKAALEAQHHLVWLNHARGQGARSAGLHTYPCPHCGAWHFGHSTPQTPTCYHYDVASALDAVADAGALVPERPTRLGRQVLRRYSGRNLALCLGVEERAPLNWFSWSATWDPRSAVLPHPGHFVGRPAAERLEEGMVQLACPAWVAKLRWNDYTARNKTTPLMRKIISAEGRPADWLATDQAVPCVAIRGIHVWSDGRWVDVDDEEPTVATS